MGKIVFAFTMYCSVSLSNSAKPFWEVEPTDFQTTIKSTASFICKARGYPEPTIQWFINGVRLAGTCNKVCYVLL
jgi:hypothetical protein